MSVSLTDIVYGQNGWDKVTMANFKAVATGLDKKITNSGWISEGITLLNGFLNFTNGLIDVPAYKIYYVDGKPWRMLLKGSVLVPSDVSGASYTCLSVPKAVTDFLYAVPEAQVHTASLSDKLTIPIMIYINKTDATITATCAQALPAGARIQLNSVYE